MKTKEDYKYFIGMLVSQKLITDKKVISYFGDKEFQNIMSIYHGVLG